MVGAELFQSHEPGPHGLPHAGARYQGSAPSSTAFLGHKQRAAWEMQQLGHKLAPIGDPKACKLRIEPLSHCPQDVLEKELITLLKLMHGSPQIIQVIQPNVNEEISLNISQKSSLTK